MYDRYDINFRLKMRLFACLKAFKVYGFNLVVAFHVFYSFILDDGLRNLDLARQGCSNPPAPPYDGRAERKGLHKLMMKR